MTETVFTNALVVTPETALPGTVVVRAGRIAEVDSGRSALRTAVDCEGDVVLPGLIDLHTDNIERHIFPRPGVTWPSPLGVVLAHDRDVIGCGITTVLDSLSCGDYDNGGARRKMLGSAIGALGEARAAGLFAADHLLHLRCETSDAAVLDIVEPQADNPMLALMSLMDHTPGQRQWRDLDLYRAYRRTKKNVVWTDDEFADYLAEVTAFRNANARRFAKRLQELAEGRNVVLASHDDATIADVEESISAGVTVAEFPTTIEAAEHARARGLKVVMGSPNIVLGRSHSGNVGAAALHARGLVDMLCSDYVPSSLIEAVFRLAAEGTSLPAAVALATVNVADALHMSDRGAIVPGRRADLIRVKLVGTQPVVRRVWRDGVQVAVGAG